MRSSCGSTSPAGPGPAPRHPPSSPGTRGCAHERARRAGDRDELRRDGRRDRARPRAARQRHREQHGRATPATAVSFPRSPRGRTSKRCSPPSRRRSSGPGSRPRRSMRSPVTSGPGLAGALMVGIGAAKALALGWGRPLYAVNHLVGHIAADLLDADALRWSCPRSPSSSPAGTPRCPRPRPRLRCRAPRRDRRRRRGGGVRQVARILGLPYPGGPEIDRAAASGDRGRSPSRADSRGRRILTRIATTSRSRGSRPPSRGGSSSARAPGRTFPWRMWRPPSARRSSMCS